MKKTAVKKTTKSAKPKLMKAAKKAAPMMKVKSAKKTTQYPKTAAKSTSVVSKASKGFSVTKVTKPVAKSKVSAKGSVSAKSNAILKTMAPMAKSVSKPNTNKVTTQTLSAANKKPESFFKTFLKPLDDRIVVIVEEAPTMTPGGLYIPATTTDTAANYQGKVMAIGRGHMNKKGKVKPLDVSLGDTIVFSVFSGSQIDVDGNNIMVVRETDVLGIVK